MHNNTLATLLIAATTIGFTGNAQAQTPAPAAAPPLFATTKVEGTDNVYVFRYQNHQSMFVVTPAGVIATDPISYGRPQAATYWGDRKITKARQIPDHSHHHYDHIAGGKRSRTPARRDRARAPRSGWRCWDPMSSCPTGRDPEAATISRRHHALVYPGKPFDRRW